MKNLALFVIILVSFFVFSSCSTCPTLSKEQLQKEREKNSKETWAFDDGIRYMAQEILYQLVQSSRSPKDKVIGINQFLFYETGRKIKIQDRIKYIIAEELRECFKVGDLDTSLQTDYIMEGVLFYDKGTSDEDKKIPHFYVSVIDFKTKIIHAAVNVKFSDFDISPDIIDEKNPILSTGQYRDHKADTVKKGVNEKVSDNYPVIIENDKKLMMGDALFEEEKYEAAIPYYLEMLKKENELGREWVERAYERLYTINYQLGKMKEAKEYLEQLISIRIQYNQKIELLVKFKVASCEFIEETKEQCNKIIESIANHFKYNPGCLEIYGHTSETGTIWYNCPLSKRRADKIQDLMVNILPNIKHKSLTRGRAFLEPKVGGGKEDENDRRVEFNVIKCEELEEKEREVKNCEQFAKEKGHKRK